MPKAIRQTIRVTTHDMELADSLVDRLTDTRECVMAGGHWGRAAVLRWAASEGLKVLAAIAATKDQGK